LFIAIQIPFADLRPFLDEETARLAIPGWPNPQVDVEFVRAVGAVRERRHGGLSPWVGEGYYANAARALRFLPGFAGWPPIGQANAARLPCVFRRYFSDGGAVARVEVGFGPRNEKLDLEGLGGSELVDLIAGCLAVPVRVPMPAGEWAAAELIGAGRPIARHLLRSTTTNNSGGDSEGWWLRALRPTAIVAYESSEVSDLPATVTTVPMEPGGPSIHHAVLARGGISVPVWFIPWEQTDNADEMRRIRLHLFRLHAEREVFKWTLSAAAQGRLTGASDIDPWNRLQRYLNDTIRLLRRDRGYGIDSSEELKSALRLGDLMNPGDRESLLAQFEGMRTNVFRKVEEVPSQQGRQPIIYVEKLNQFYGKVNMDDHSKMDDHSTNLGDVLNSQLEGVFGSSNTVQDSFNRIGQSGASDDVKSVLKELVEAVGKLGEGSDVAPADRETAARDLDGLVREATAASPRRGMVETLGDGLIQTAKKVGEVGLPIVKLVTQLIALFG
jgi:hypothetical protein